MAFRDAGEALLHGLVDLPAAFELVEPVVPAGVADGRLEPAVARGFIGEPHRTESPRVPPHESSPVGR